MTQANELEEALEAFLSRFSPPRHIADNPQAIEAEAAQIVAAFARFAPADGFADWWQRVTTELVRRMKTRAWPLVSEVEAACQAARSASPSTATEDAIEAMILDRMEDWFRRTHSQMPGYGRPSRTMALIRRGVLRDEREARFRGFDMTQDMRDRAHGQKIGPDELAAHRLAMSGLRATAAQQEANRDG